MTELIALALAALLAENLLLARFLGAESLLRQYGGFRRSVTAGLTVTAVMVLSAPLTWAADFLLLRTFGLEYLRVLVFLLLIVLIARILQVLLSLLPRLEAQVGELIPLAAVNSAVLGGVLTAARSGLDLGETMLAALFGGLGFTLAAVLLSSIRGRLAFSKCPRAFEGTPIALVTAGLLAMAFLGFSGLRV